MITIEQLKEVRERADKLKQYLAIDEKRVQLEEEELHTQAPGHGRVRIVYKPWKAPIYGAFAFLCSQNVPKIWT